MNLRWDGTFHRFVADFSSDFQGDLAAVKAAGFKTEGPPSWIWYSNKPGPLTKLRENRPASGLTITPEAREQYNALAALEAKNAEIRAAANKAVKELKKSLLKKDPNMPEKGYIEASDLPPMPPFEKTYVCPAPPETKCFICSDPVYFYEKQDPPTCLWCEIKVLDNSAEVC